MDGTYSARGKIRTVYKILVGIPEERDLGLGGKTVLQLILVK
jgi:hypothetical protein